MTAPGESVPYNPFSSFVITASAGSGKTWQLTERYLRLAAALEDLKLSRILTVTFTRKAAAEMRQRIIESAARLVSSPRAEEEMGREMRAWSGGRGAVFPAQAANAILRNSQSMRVVTMDSFFGWLSARFSVEAGLPVGAEIAEGEGLLDLLRTAARRLLNSEEALPLLETAALLLEGEIDPILDFCRTLYRSYRPTLFLRYRGDWERMESDLALSGHDPYPLSRLSADLLAWLGALLEGWPASARGGEELRELCRAGDAAKLISSAFFKPQKEIFPATGRNDIEFSVNRSRLPPALRERAEEADSFLRRYLLCARVDRYNRLIRVLVGCYRVYERLAGEAKAEVSAMDFSDIAVGAFRLLEDPGIAFTVQSGVQHLLIDEFQDTSRLQWEIFRPMMEELTAGRGIFENQSFFAVGDVKQSIYGFREADYTLLEGLAASAARSGNARLVPLSRSYRSSPLIIDFVNAVFRSSGLDGFVEHETDLPRIGGSVTVYPLVKAAEGTTRKGDRWALDAKRIADSIQSLVDKKVPVAEKPAGPGREDWRFRPARFGDIAVIYRKKGCARSLEEELARRNIPCRRDEPGGFYRRDEVRDLLAFLDFLCDPHDRLALAALLRSPLCSLSEEDFSKVLRRAGRGSLRAALARVFPEASRLLERSLASSASSSPAQAAEAFLQATSARLRYRLFTGDDLAALNLDRMIDLLSSLSARGAGTVFECRRFLRRMSEEDETAMAGGAGECVRLMTVHKAKGLEFPILYLFDAAFTSPATGREKSFELLRRTGDDSPPVVYFPPASCSPEGNPVFDSWAAQAAEEAKREELRILYVALTRAAQRLFVSGVEPGTKEESESHRLILAGARALAASGKWTASGHDHLGQAAEVNLSDPTVLPFLPPVCPTLPVEVDESLLSPPSVPGLALVRPSDLAEEDHPDEKEEDPPEIPEKKRSLGIAVHRALEETLAGRPFSAERFLDWLMGAGHPDRGWVEEELSGDRRRLEAGGYFDRFRGARVRTEVTILRRESLDGGGERLIRGAVDLIASYPDRIDFYDYKTARISSGRVAAETARYRPQMELYAEALRVICGLPVTGYLVFTALGEVVRMVKNEKI
jgi:ATP-dependent helicase/nuclease subunit A